MHDVALFCQFGQPPRGVSAYADALLEALQAECETNVTPIDYDMPYPRLLHPAAKDSCQTSGTLHWARPLTWRKAAVTNHEIIHIQHWLSPMAVYLSSLVKTAKKNGKKIIVTVHNPSPHENLTLFSLFEAKLLKRADALIVHDERAANLLNEKTRIARKKIHVIPHGVRTQDKPCSAQIGDHASINLDPERKYICIFGNLRGYKGVDVLLKAWLRIANKTPDYDLVIAGRFWSGQDSILSKASAAFLGTSTVEHKIRKLLSLKGLSGRVQLLEGFQPDQNIDSLLRISEFAVFPYVRFSSQSGAACRAAGLGCPVLVTDVGALPSLAIDSTWIVKPNCVSALASRLLEKIRTTNRLRSRRLQLNKVNQFDWNQIARMHDDVYRSLY